MRRIRTLVNGRSPSVMRNNLDDVCVDISSSLTCIYVFDGLDALLLRDGLWTVFETAEVVCLFQWRVFVNGGGRLLLLVVADAQLQDYVSRLIQRYACARESRLLPAVSSTKIVVRRGDAWRTHEKAHGSFYAAKESAIGCTACCAWRAAGQDRQRLGQEREQVRARDPSSQTESCHPRVRQQRRRRMRTSRRWTWMWKQAQKEREPAWSRTLPTGKAEDCRAGAASQTLTPHSASFRDRTHCGPSLCRISPRATHGYETHEAILVRPCGCGRS